MCLSYPEQQKEKDRLGDEVRCKDKKRIYSANEKNKEKLV